MSVQSITSGLSSGLISALDFQLKKNADYIRERRSVSYLPSAGDTWSPAGARDI